MREWESREQRRARMQSERDREREREIEIERDRESERESLATNAWSRLLFSVMAQNDISVIRKNKPTK